MKTLRFHAVLLAGFLSLRLNCVAAESPYLYGIHDADPDPNEYMSHVIGGVGSGWVTATVAVGADPNNFGSMDFSALAARGYTIICRLNYGYYPDGTIPLSSQYDNFATRCKNFVQNSRGCSIWVIGNEVNLPSEWPFDGSRFSYVSPQNYGTCYGKVANAIRSVRASDKICPAPAAAFAGPFGPGNQSVNGGVYPCDGVPLNWVQYENQLLTDCKSKGPVDGITLHVYSRGYASSDVHSTAQVNAGGQNLYWSFYCYKDWVNYGIPTSMWNLPVYVTECDGYYYWKGGHPEDPTKHYQAGWMQDVYAEIDSYNKSAYSSGKPIIHCLNMYRWCGFCDGWNIDGADDPYKGQILTDLDGAIWHKYSWKANQSQGNSISAPGSVTAGSTFTATVQMQNIGTGQWKSGNATPHRLGSQSPQDNTTWGFNRVELPASPINPGSAATFNFTCTAPATAGTYTFAWRMVQDGVEWFGDTLSTTIQVTYAPVVVDNSSSGFTCSTNWSTGTAATNKYGTDYRFRNTQTVSDAATWSVSLGSSGSYQVAAWWANGSNRSAAAPYIIYHSTGSTTVSVNQQINGGIWNTLGTFSLNAGANSVKLSCWTTETNKVVLADALRWWRQ